ncbi:hypothetical protein CIB93_30165 [Streptomyces sp. WZ.A104]|uniref:hypothetical protein n=1 Tax=Streptomyces sp. WZ.A104 TaxID=2023771 RepID=UPI000BBB8DB1|nr:hypothetical protein [Streptomyces sp. WZ.A104]PCG82425.1 hypothetical protein CIB93_30165 [Streptomyces sp. WZ.A104]
MHRVGIESDQLVYDYLSRVGDLAQRQQLSSGARMRLVSTLRGEIDRQRGAGGADSPAAVRRIISRLGSPDALVAAAAESGDGSVPPPSARPGGGAGAARREKGRGAVPRPRSGLLRKGAKDPGPAPDATPVSAPASAPGSAPDPAPKAGSGRGASRRGGGSAADGGADAGSGARPRPRTNTGRASGAPTGAGHIPGARTSDADASRRGAAGLLFGKRGAERPGPDSARPRTDTDDATARDWPDPSAPHMLGDGQQASGEPDWWRLEPGPFDQGTAIPGFFGGIEAPELLGRPPKPDSSGEDEEDDEPGIADSAAEDDTAEDGDGEDGGGEEAVGTDRRRRAPRLLKLRRRKAPAPAVVEPAAAAPAPRRGFAHPLLLLAALLLLAGVVTGSWLPLAGGWLIAYSSRTLSRTEAKWAALGLPGVVAAGALVWVWGRLDGRWGEPIREGAMRDVLLDAWPVVVRVAAVASALYLVWRARGRTG